MTVDLPLSAGRIVISLSDFKLRSASLSSLEMLLTGTFAFSKGQRSLISNEWPHPSWYR